MAEVAFILCAATSLACALLLYRGYRRNGVRLLFWSALCFFGLTLNNVLLFIDLNVAPDAGLEVFRSLPALFGLAALLYGLIWEAK